MTITTSQSQISYTGNSATTVFAFPFLIPLVTDIVVTLIQAGVVTTLAPSLYGVTGAGNPAGGSVTYPLVGSPIDSTIELTISRVLPFTQTSSFNNQATLNLSVLEGALDAGVMQVQQLATAVGKTLQFPPGDTSAGYLPVVAIRANSFLGFDSSGNPIAAAGTSANLTPVSSFVNTLLGSANASVFAGLIGLGPTVFAKFAQFMTDAAAGVARYFNFTTNGVDRWSIGATADAESGSNSGSNFVVQRFTDLGALIGNWLSVNRATGAAVMASSLDVQALTVNGVGLSQIVASSPFVGTPGATGLVVKTTSTTTLNVVATFVSLITALDYGYKIRNPNVNLNIGTIGAGGLDTGALAPNTFYFLFCIYNPTTSTLALLMSLSATAPTLPSGYTAVVRIGAVRINASSQLLQTVQRGESVQITQTPLPLMTSGTVGSVSIPTWIAVPIFAPTTAAKIEIIVVGVQNQNLILAPNNTYGPLDSTTNPPYNFGGYAYVTSNRQELVVESPNIYWANSAGGYIFAVGWEDNL